MTKNALRFLAIPAALALLCAAPATAQFDTYVALGDSLTAGFEANCLVERNQLASFPAVIAQQLGMTDFEQPLVQELALTSPLVGNPCLGAVFVPPSTVTVGPISQQGAPLNALLGRPYNNLGIPGATVADLVDLTQGNPSGDTAERFSVLVLRNVPGSPFEGLNAVTEANLLGPDLVTLWVGANDILPAALTGLFLPGVTVTPLAVFEQKYAEVLEAIVAGNRTIVAGNVPDVSDVPFATTVPARLTIPGGSTPVLGPGNAAFPCAPVAPDTGCPVPDGTLVTLPASALLAQGIGVPRALGGLGTPLPDGEFIPPSTVVPGVLLYPDELADIQELITAYNEIIADQIAAAGGHLVDINAIFGEIKAHGYHIGGITLTANFLSGGIFSADGFHPSSIGYTIVADEFIQVMNAELDLAIPRPDFNHVLFTPNVPQTGSGLRSGDPSAYSFGMWAQLIESSNMARGFSLKLPELPARPARGAGPRVVARD